ncbi:putative phospholipid-transporting ATPase VD [Nymphon striatum]|nr:putative phospholipid-transporting ATPase VD [Nymphon striatum]
MFTYHYQHRRKCVCCLESCGSDGSSEAIIFRSVPVINCNKQEKFSSKLIEVNKSSLVFPCSSHKQGRCSPCESNNNPRDLQKCKKPSIMEEHGRQSLDTNKPLMMMMTIIEKSIYSGRNMMLEDLTDDKFELKCWKDVLVGDIVRLSCNEVIPADILLLRSSDEKGICFLETSNLDGESNLKQRQVVRGYSSNCQSFHPTNFQSKIECDAPNNKIYRFHGSIIESNDEKIPLNKENLILRDCILKNTGFVEGIVVYAGQETKTMLNNDGPRYKRSNLEKLMNWDVAWCVLILVVLCSIGAIGSGLWVSHFDNSTIVPYIPFGVAADFNPAMEGFLAFWTFVIILQVMIPLSLYVSIEIVKLGQVYFIHEDIELYDSRSNKRLECRALNIPEELGQIQYVFSDKTGTLTENHMIFRRCTIGGVDFNHHHPSLSENSLHLQSDTTFILNSSLQDSLSKMEAQLRSAHKIITPVTPSSSPHHKLSMQFSLTPDSQRIQDFFLLMALCNTVVVSSHPHKDLMNYSGIYDPSAAGTSSDSPDGMSIKRYNLDSEQNTSSHSESPSSPKSYNKSHLDLPLNGDRGSIYSAPTPTDVRPIFEAESPDELALVDCAFRYNCRLLSRTQENALLALPGEGIVEYKILHVLPFDSYRKRMSVILECPLTNEKILYCKGADSTILTQLAPVNDPEMSDIVMKTQHHLNNYSKKGLRILCMAKKVICDTEYKEWSARHKEAELAFENREKLLMQSANDMECNLELLGATGIEDRLQEGVPECLQALGNAGIVVWVLTGDKQKWFAIAYFLVRASLASPRMGAVSRVHHVEETAVNIAYSCKLFSYDMEIITVNARSKDSTKSTLAFYLDQISKDLEIPVQKSPSKNWFRSKFRKMLNKNSGIQSPRHLAYNSTRRRKRALVVDGRTLTFALDKELEKMFLKLALHCGAVLCCRVTPLQKVCVHIKLTVFIVICKILREDLYFLQLKASLVKLVKEGLKVKTLAIGDGANDVSMIQTAAVGIGISGQEGMQAVMASDFAMGRFHHLERLLLVHGHWCYVRLATMVLYFFYKNAGFIFVLFWYQLYCGFSGMVAIDQLYLMFYNLIFTSFPPLICGIFDQDASDDMLLSNPMLYRVGKNSQVYKSYSFWLNMLDAFYQSIIIFFVCYFTYYDSTTGIWEFGTTLTTACVFVQLLHLAIETKSWTWMHVFGIIMSILLYLSFGLCYNAVCDHCYSLPYWKLSVKGFTTTILPCCTCEAMLADKEGRKSRRNSCGVSFSRSSSDSSSVFTTNDKDGVSTIEPLTANVNNFNQHEEIGMQKFPIA